MHNLVDDIRRVIMALFGRIPPGDFQWTQATVARARTLVSDLDLRLTEPESMFVESLKTLLRQTLGNINIEVNYEPSGSAWNVSSYEAVQNVVYEVLICGFYPVSTLRPWTYPPPSEGLDQQWHFDPQSAEVKADVQSKLVDLAAPLEHLFGSYRYHFVPWDSSELQQIIRIGLLAHRKVWDYLFYLGLPD